ncbi:hypothetical protein MYX64_09830 [Nitrospinae bacterium AH_259_B05_G02_I21]|nr:hypothetical protein [Nitrospinae bacterium AH_259_B05_G02_I21]MDA2932647.1 hypothetical protein [Nitrospinae bacterium AH-259-F20]
MNRFLTKFIKISLPTIVVTLFLLVLAIEVWVRFSWDPKRGSPGFYIASFSRLEQLAPNYSGWFAGVPIRTNNLGFRDPRDYSLDKSPNTFRIVVLGDSVTFGHGALYETTYPYLLETKLKSWKPDVDWQVWNLAVPGYKTSQELMYLLDIGPSYLPDLVVVGFYENDIIGNLPERKATRVRLLVNRTKSFLKTHFYSYEFYKKAYLQLSSTLFASDIHRQMLKNLFREEKQLLRLDWVANLEEQKLTPLKRIPNRHRLKTQCPSHSNPNLIDGIRRATSWHNTVDRLQRLNREGTYRILFFVNISPDICAKDDLFYHGPHKLLNEYFLEVFSNGGTPVVSSYDAFYPYRPSQMPLAQGHSLGNANLVKAETLFQFLKNHFFPRIPKFTSKRN